MTGQLSEMSTTASGVPERFVPETMRGQLVEAEHLARYWWASQHVLGRVVLDAGCGTAYGSRILAEAGASEVIGVDSASEVLEAARPLMPRNVTLSAGDVRSLPYDDETFDAVVCFEVIEHIEEQDRALDEIARVLKPAGYAVVSSPNRDVYVPGNPHHVRELSSQELLEALARRFPVVRAYRQHDWISSAVLPDEVFSEEARSPLDGVRTLKSHAREPGEELVTIAVAGKEEVPAFHPTVCMTHELEFRRWLALYDQLDEAAAESRAKADLADSLLEERARLGEELLRAEELGARVKPLEAALAERDRVIERLRTLNDAEREAFESQRAALEEEFEAKMARLEEELEQAKTDLDLVRSSISWRLTRPLRVASGSLRALRTSRLARWIQER